MIRRASLQWVLWVLFVLYAACRAPAKTGAQNQPPTTTASATLQFITADYIGLDRVEKISKFRSSAGHDFSDSSESCRSMKHYFWPKGGDPGAPHSPSWTTIRIYSPVKGTVARIIDEWTGRQVWLQPDGHPEAAVRIFHVNLNPGVKEGAHVAAGQNLGRHASDETMSDIAVELREGDGRRRLVSYFDVMSDSVFENYRARGIESRHAMTIPEADRDADPSTCAGESFTASGRLDSWAALE